MIIFFIVIEVTNKLSDYVIDLVIGSKDPPGPNDLSASGTLFLLNSDVLLNALGAEFVKAAFNCHGVFYDIQADRAF
jgi:hypothetical protein